MLKLLFPWEGLKRITILKDLTFFFFILTEHKVLFSLKNLGRIFLEEKSSEGRSSFSHRRAECLMSLKIFASLLSRTWAEGLQFNRRTEHIFLIEELMVFHSARVEKVFFLREVLEKSLLLKGLNVLCFILTEQKVFFSLEHLFSIAPFFWNTRMSFSDLKHPVRDRTFSWNTCISLLFLKLKVFLTDALWKSSFSRWKVLMVFFFS